MVPRRHAAPYLRVSFRCFCLPFPPSVFPSLCEGFGLPGLEAKAGISLFITGTLLSHCRA